MHNAPDDSCPSRFDLPSLAESCRGADAAIAQLRQVLPHLDTVLDNASGNHEELIEVEEGIRGVAELVNEAIDRLGPVSAALFSLVNKGVSSRTAVASPEPTTGKV